MRPIKIGDKKPARTLDAKKPFKEMVMDAFDNLTTEDEEARLLDLKQKQREVNERAKKRF